jgi:hypothetical protein
MKVVEQDAQSLRVSWAAEGGERRDNLRRAATLIGSALKLIVASGAGDRNEEGHELLVGAPGLEPGTR